MTKRRVVIELLERNGFVNLGGSKHDKFEHPDGRKTRVPRHRDIKDRLFREIKKQTGLK